MKVYLNTAISIGKDTHPRDTVVDLPDEHANALVSIGAAKDAADPDVPKAAPRKGPAKLSDAPNAVEK